MYIRLKKMTREDAEKYRKEFNDDRTLLCEGWYEAIGQDKEVPKDAREEIIDRILIIFHNKIFGGTAEGWIRGNEAWIKEEDYKRLF